MPRNLTMNVWTHTYNYSRQLILCHFSLFRPHHDRSIISSEFIQDKAKATSTFMSKAKPEKNLQQQKIQQNKAKILFR